VLRISVGEKGQPELPPLDLDAARIVIGSAVDAHVRLPSSAARREHVVVERGKWLAVADVVVDDQPRRANETGELGDAVAFDIGGFRVRVARAPANTQPSTPQRTESLARELMRSLLGNGAAPALTIERGTNRGAKRALRPPESVMVIGRGDDADWPILDEDLSRKHLEVRRTWEGTTIRDLDSQNGTIVDGKRIANSTLLRDGMHIDIGNLRLVFEDPAERHLRSSNKAPAVRDEPPPPSPPKPKPSIVPFVIALAIAGLALAGLVYVLAA
jgi:hypothetical protein